MFAFIETAETEAWHPGETKPAVILLVWGTPKFRDLATFAQALLPGQTLRVVADSRLIRSALDPFCATHALRIVYTTEDRVLTAFGCYAHYYVDIQLDSPEMRTPQAPA